MQEPTRILYIDDSKVNRRPILRALRIAPGGFHITEAASRQALEAHLADGDFDVILADFDVFGFEGLEVLDAVRSRNRRTPVVIVTGTGTEEFAVEAMKRGASDYVVKTPHRIRSLPRTSRAAIDRSRPAHEQNLAFIERKAQARQQEVVARLGQQALAGLDLQALMQMSSTLVAETLALPYCCILEGRPSDEAALLRAGCGWPAGWTGHAEVPFGRDDLIGVTLRAQHPVLFEDLRAENPFTVPDGLGIDGLAGGVGVAIRGKEGPLGMLGAFSTTVECFTRHDVNFLLSVANVLAMAIERKQFELDLIVAKEKAVELNRLKTAFLTNMSHEIRTPLTSIIGFASILASEIEGEHSSLIHLIEQSGHRLLGTLNAILDLSMLEAGTLPLNPEPLDLASEVRNTASHFNPLAAQKGLTLRIDAEAATVFLDRSCLDRILHNLIGNAIKFTREGGVTIGVGTSGNRAEICIQDTGIGISTTFRPYLFDAFQQESMGMARSHEGTGLGLAVTRGFVELMDGRLTVSSEQDLGSTFVVSFPRYAEQDTPIRR